MAFRKCVAEDPEAQDIDFETYTDEKIRHYEFSKKFVDHVFGVKCVTGKCPGKMYWNGHRISWGKYPLRQAICEKCRTTTYLIE